MIRTLRDPNLYHLSRGGNTPHLPAASHNDNHSRPILCKRHTANTVFTKRLKTVKMKLTKHGLIFPTFRKNVMPSTLGVRWGKLSQNYVNSLHESKYKNMSPGLDSVLQRGCTKVLFVNVTGSSELNAEARRCNTTLLLNKNVMKRCSHVTNSNLHPETLYPVSLPPDISNQHIKTGHDRTFPLSSTHSHNNTRRYTTKGKGKVHPRTGHEGPEGEQRYSSTLTLISALDGGGWSTPRPGRFTPGKDPVPTVQDRWAPEPV